MTQPGPVHLDPLTDRSFQAHQDGIADVFTVRETTEGWKTEGHPYDDGMLFDTRDALIAYLERRGR